jgi:hypothetical protein
MLPVAVASHTPLLTKASAAFRQELNEAPMPVEMPTGIRLLSGTDGAPIFDVRSGADKISPANHADSRLGGMHGHMSCGRRDQDHRIGTRSRAYAPHA